MTIPARLSDATGKGGSCLPGLSTVERHIAGGQFHTLAVDSVGSVWTWGYNRAGQLGDGTTTQRTTPVKVTGLIGKIVSVAGGGGPQSGAAGGHSTALASTGHVWTWGANDSGKLGRGTSDGSAHSIPVAAAGGLQGGTNLGDISPIVAIAGGRNHDLAVSADGKVWAWGAGDSGQLGDGGSVQRNTPIEVDQTTMVNPAVDVAAGDAHSLAIDSTGKVWAWGQNADGELGDGTSMSRSPLSWSRFRERALRSTLPAQPRTAWRSCPMVRRGPGETTPAASSPAVGEEPPIVSSQSRCARRQDPSPTSSPRRLGRIQRSAHERRCRVGCRTQRLRRTGRRYHDAAEYVGAAKTSSGVTTASAIAAGQDHSIAVSLGKVYTFGFNKTSSMTPPGGGQLEDGTATSRSTPSRFFCYDLRLSGPACFG